MIPDNYDLWLARERELAERLEHLPKCSICGEPIQQERAFHLDGFWICDECYVDNKKEVNE